MTVPNKPNIRGALRDGREPRNPAFHLGQRTRWTQSAQRARAPQDSAACHARRTAAGTRHVSRGRSRPADSAETGRRPTPTSLSRPGSPKRADEARALGLRGERKAFHFVIMMDHEKMLATSSIPSTVSAVGPLLCSISESAPECAVAGCNGGLRRRCPASCSRKNRERSAQFITAA